MCKVSKIWYQSREYQNVIIQQHGELLKLMAKQSGKKLGCWLGMMVVYYPTPIGD